MIIATQGLYVALFRVTEQSMPGDTCDHTCEIPSTSEKSPLSTSLSTVQSHSPDRTFVVVTVTLATVTICFNSSTLLVLS